MLFRSYCDALLALLDSVPPANKEKIDEVFLKEFGEPPAKLFAEFNYTAIASASIGQVHKAKLFDQTEVAVKVQRPGIRTIFARDNIMLEAMVRFILFFHIRRLYFMRDAVRELSTWTLDELDYRREASYCQLLGQNAAGNAADSLRADIAVACDGVNSAIRRQFYPDEQLIFTGINAWRGVTKHKPIWDGRTYMRVGSIRTGKIVIYPIADNIDGQGNQLINWTTEFEAEAPRMNDWNKPGKTEDFFHVFKDWRFEWLDVAQMILDSDVVLEYPMCDKDPIVTWTFGRVTLAGDAAHPMYPRGSNGSAQAVIDVRVLADLLARGGDVQATLKEYEAARAAPTAQVVRTNRAHPPDFINIKVEELTGDKPFDNLDKYITQDELRTLSDSYKRVAGFALADVKPQVKA